MQSCTHSKTAQNQTEENKTPALPALSIKLVFSHNLNGETEPCGCRHFPLGGIAQVAGQIYQFKQNGHVVFVDTGDSLFTSPIIPASRQESLIYNARRLAEAFDQLGLNYFVPGDQDFAAGEHFLGELSNQRKFKFLLANLSESSVISHLRWEKQELGPFRFYFTGVLSPQGFTQDPPPTLLPVESALKQVIEQIESDGFDRDNPYHRFIVLSHSGMDLDETLAKSFPQIQWIIGAHTQSFTQTPNQENGVNIVQVLSRNHYLGSIDFSPVSTSEDKFSIHEIHQELFKLWPANPLDEFVRQHRTKIKELRDKEDSILMGHSASSNTKDKSMPDMRSCRDCHRAAYKFHSGKPHSLAWYSLIGKEQQNNPACIGCHSIGFGSEGGFQSAQEIVDGGGSGQENWNEQYWTAFQKTVYSPQSVRKMNEKDIRAAVDRWEKHDQLFGVTRNLANVQCLACHQKNPSHPFEPVEQKMAHNQRLDSIKDRCLSCHDPDQSPEWYQEKSKGNPGPVNLKVYLDQLKKMTCPKER